jgi:hypothetical protein
MTKGNLGSKEWVCIDLGQPLGSVNVFTSMLIGPVRCAHLQILFRTKNYDSLKQSLTPYSKYGSLVLNSVLNHQEIGL